MVIGTCKVYLTAQWVGSLKEKRTVVKSILEKMKNKFNISAAEVEFQDVHQQIGIGFACVTNNSSHADSIINNVLNFIEWNTEAQIYDTLIEIF